MTDLAPLPAAGDPLAQLLAAYLDGRRSPLTRSLRHRHVRRRSSPYVWGCVPVISPYLDRLRAAAFDPCWRTSPEGREYVAMLERSINYSQAEPRKQTPYPRPDRGQP